MRTIRHMAAMITRAAIRPAAVVLFLIPCAVLSLAIGGAPASAYDAATTHAGMTQQAAVASGLHHVLVSRLARPLGVFEPVALHPELIKVDERRPLAARLAALDPFGGYRPGDDGVATALGFLVAGSVIAKTPGERVQHLFLDPSTGAGLRDDAAVDGFLHSLRMVADGRGSLRAAATGTGFSFEGESSLAWLDEPNNDVGLRVFQQQIERAIAEPEAAVRSSALARALLALGGVLTALEDAGNPAQVRNDFRASYLRGQFGSPFDRFSPFERLVADRYGFGGVPAADEVVRRPNFRAFFTAPDGQGLADRTQRRFFSDGTIPADGVVDNDTSTADVVHEARKSLPFALPTVPRLELRDMGVRRYVLASDAAGGRPRRLLGYERVPGRVRFFLDGRVYADSARVLLPEIVGYAAGLIDHLFRAEVRLSRDRDQLRAVVASTAGRLRGGRLRLLAEDPSGRRREVASFAPTEVGAEGVIVAVPPQARRMAAVMVGEDDAGPVVAFGELALPARR